MKPILIEIPLIRENEKFKAVLCKLEASLDELIVEKEHFLHAQEQDYFATLKYPRRQHSYLLGRYCAKQAVADYFDETDLTQIHIAQGIFKQPLVEYATEKRVLVSLSHCQNRALALVTSAAHPMGIDLEAVQAERSDAIKSQMSEDEIQLAQGLNFDVATQLTLLWTIKEALSKVFCCGLMADLKVFKVKSMQPQGDFIVSLFKHFAQYKVYSFVEDHFVCSIVCPKNTDMQLKLPME